MFKQGIHHPPLPNPLPDERAEGGLHPGDVLEQSGNGSNSVPLPFQEGDFKRLLGTLSQKKARGEPAWLQEVIGWGGFIGILAVFLVLQIFLNGTFKGLVNQLAIGLSIVLEIGLLWFWELYWY